MTDTDEEYNGQLDLAGSLEVGYQAVRERVAAGGEPWVPKIDPFHGLPRGHYGAILADPPWRFRTWNKATAIKRRGGDSHGTNVCASVHYSTMAIEDIAALPVADLCAPNTALFLWSCWPTLQDAFDLIEAWGFEYKTCAFDWIKAHAGQLDMLRDDTDALMGMGYWTRSNSEPCLLATRGKPKRLNADVRQGIIEPRREHSRKPDCVHERIERLVGGPYLELFARQSRPGWTTWGNEATKFDRPTLDAAVTQA
jgi:N6-adenosine-specific RNA methylase IME4